MIFIDPYDHHNGKAFNIHVEFLLPYVKKQRDKLLNKDLKFFLQDYRLRAILSDKPSKLIDHHRSLLKSLPKYSLKEWEGFLQAKKDKRKRKKLTKNQEALITKYNGLHDEISTVFKYTGGFATKKFKPYNAYDLAENLHRQSCTYCNRIYTKTVINPDKTIRPEFDHWFPKGTYPLLALSFYNLIPSCHVCNSSVKGTTDMNLDEYIHPYVDEDIKYTFSYWIKDVDEYRVKIVRNPESKEDNTIKAFKLEQIYAVHRDEINDLVRTKKLYSIRHLLELQDLLKDKSGQTASLPELYRLAYGTHYLEKNFYKRPLSKMKRDILEELEMILK